MMCLHLWLRVAWCENTRAAWQLFFTARTWAKPHRFDSSVTLLLRRVVQSKTQWHSNVLKLLKLLQKSSQASKTFFQLLQIKRLQLKLTNNLQNSYQISSQQQVPKTWVKQHPKTPKTTKTNENPSPSSSMHKLLPFGSKLVPTFFFRPTPSWLPPGRPTRSIVCYKLGRMVNWCKNGRLLIEWRQEWTGKGLVYSPVGRHKNATRKQKRANTKHTFQIGSYLVPMGSYGFYSSQIGSYKLKMVT